MGKVLKLAGVGLIYLVTIQASCPPNPPDPSPTPEPTPTPDPDPGPNIPPNNVGIFNPLLLRQANPPFLVRVGDLNFKPNGFVQCCMATNIGVSSKKSRPRKPKPFRLNNLQSEVNSRWPSISIPVMQYAVDNGNSNFFEIRVAPYLGDPDHESEWSDIGGPVSNWPNFNQAWWDENRKIIYHAGLFDANVKVIWDAWYGKTCKNGSQPCNWPNSEIQAWGETFTQGHKLFIDKIVQEFGCMMNVVWSTDNEGALVQRANKSYYESVYWAFRDAENRFQCNINGTPTTVVHLIYTNWPEIGDGPYDAVSTHDDGPLTKSFFGKHSDNNERNGTTYSASQDHSMFCDAQKDGNHFFFWRAEDSDSLMNEKLALRKSGCSNSNIQCFVPGSNDPNWNSNPTPGGDPGLKSGVESMKLSVGERCGASDKYAALDIAAEEMRNRGYCSTGRWGDALAVKCPDDVENGECVQEFHLVEFTQGCWANNPSVLPKFTWRYNFPLPKSDACNIEVPKVDEILCKPHVPVGLIDCTPKFKGQPILPEDDPRRRVCELKAMGNADPTFKLQVQSGNLDIQAQPNPLQFKVINSGNGLVTCTVPSNPNTLCNIQVSR